MAEFESNPAYVKQRAERDQKFESIQRHLDELQRPLLYMLAQGKPATSIFDAIERHTPFSGAPVAVFLNTLSATNDSRFQYALARALAAADDRFDDRPFVKLYESTLNPSLQWSIFNTIAITRPHSSDDWHERSKSDPHISNTLSELGFRW